MNKSMIKKVKAALEAGFKKVQDSYTKGLSGWDACVAEEKAHKAWEKSLAKHDVRVEPVEVIVGIEALYETAELANSNPGCILVMQYTDQQFDDEMEASMEGEGREEKVCVYIIPEDFAKKVASAGLPFDPPVKKKAKVRK
jgi:hypothetical protein